MPNPDKTPGQKLVEEYRDQYGYSIFDHFDESDEQDIASRIDDLIARERAFLQDVLIVAQINDGCLPSLTMQEMKERISQPIIAELTPKRVLDLTKAEGWDSGLMRFTLSGSVILDAIRQQLPDVEVLT